MQKHNNNSQLANSAFVPETQEMRRKHRMLLTVFLLVLCVIVFLVGYVSWNNASHVMAERTREYLYSAVHEARDALTERQRGILTVARIVSNTPAVEQVLNPDTPENEKAVARAQVTDFLKRAVTETVGMRDVFVFTLDGNVLLDKSGKYANKLDNVSWMEEIRQGKHITLTEVSPHTEAPALIAVTPVVHNGKVLGGVLVALAIDRLKTSLPARVRVAFVSDMGIVVMSSDNYYITGTMYGIDASRDRLLRHENKMVRLTDGNREAMSLRVPDQNLTLLASTDAQTFAEPKERLLAHVFISAGSVLLVGLVLVFWSARYFSRREAGLARRYNQVVELACLATWDWEPDQHAYRLNRYFCQMLGLGDEERTFSREAITALTHPDDCHTLNTFLAADSLKTEARLDIVLRMRHSDGHWHWIESVGFWRKLGTQKDDMFASGIALDIHENKTRETFAHEYRNRLEQEVAARTLDYQRNTEALRNERSILQAVINNIPEIIYFRDAQKRLIGANHAYYNFFKLEPHQAQGTVAHMVDLLSPNSLTVMNSMDDYVLSTNNLLEVEEVVEMRNGTALFMDTCRSVMLDDTGRCIGLVGIFRDITARKDSELALERARSEAIAANRAKSEFLANMSHEIRTPLNSILGLNHLALQENPSETVCRYLATAGISARNLLGIVNDILDFSRIESGNLQIDRVAFALDETIRNVVKGLQPQAELKQIAVDLDIAREVPMHIMGDPSRFAQVLFNLLSNAIKFTSKGGVRVRAWSSELACQAESLKGRAQLHVSVEDSGIGISADQLTRLFSPFTQGDTSSTRRYGGAGLGLVLARTLVERMGGTLIAESEQGKGSCFSFSFTVDLAQPKIVQSEKITEPATLTGKRILLAEDNSINQLVAKEMLRQLGCEVDVAENGEEAVLMAVEGNYDVVLMDIQMPKLDGYDAAKLLRNFGCRIPVIAMTANALREDRDRALACGMQAHIVKPIEPDILRDVLLEWL